MIVARGFQASGGLAAAIALRRLGEVRLVPGIVTYPVAAIAVGMFLNFAAARRYVFAQR